MTLYQMLGGRSREGALVYGHANGRRLADFAALHQVRTGFHGATDLSPACSMWDW